MKVKLIGCNSTRNEVEYLGYRNLAEYEFLDYSYHARPAVLHAKLQERISCCQHYDLIILTFSQCSHSVIGLSSPRVPMLLPRTHDCIGLLLGSNERHMKLFRENSATYYCSQGWLDYGRDPHTEFLEYTEQYGREKALYLIETLYGRYKKAVLIITPGMKNINYYRQRIQDIAAFFEWQTAEINGDAALLEALVAGVPGQGTIFVEAGTPVTENMFKFL